MIKLTDLLQEVTTDDSDNLDLSGFDQIDDIISDELDKVPKNEMVLSTVAFTLAVPGIVNSIARLIKKIAEKNGIKLGKKEEPKWYDFIIKVTDSIDDYVDTPLDLALKPFLKDASHRKEFKNALKAAILTTMAIMGSVDITKLDTLSRTIAELAGEAGKEFIEAILQKSPDKVVPILKGAIKTIFK